MGEVCTLVLFISFALRTGQGQQCTLTDICGVQKQEKSIQTSNKKHFMKNVKECRDVIVKKVLEQGWDTRTTHYTLASQPRLSGRKAWYPLFAHARNFTRIL